MGFESFIPEISLTTALLISLLSVWVLVGLFHYLNRYTQRDYFTIWTAGWLFYALFLTTSITVDPARPSPALLMCQNWCVGTAAVMMFWGSFRFLKLKAGQRLIVAMLLLVTVWSYVASYEFPGELRIQVPAFGLLSLASVFTACCFFVYRKKQRYLGGGLLTLGFLGWALYLISYPFLQSPAHLLSTGFLISGVLHMFIGVSMIILVLEEVKADMHQAELKFLQQKDQADQFRGEAARHQASYRQLFENASEAIIIVSENDLGILDLNQAARTLLRIPQWLHANPVTRYCPRKTDDATSPRQWLATLCESFEADFTREDGSRVRVQVRGGPIPFGNEKACQLFLTELTQRARLEQQLRQAEKLSALGQMISGVAHELNNPLAVIKGYTDLMLLSHNLHHDTRGTLIKVAQESNRAARLVHNFLSFAGAKSPEHKPLFLNYLVREILEIRTREFAAAQTELIVNIASEPIPIMGDAGQISQLLGNLLNNALQAMAAQSARRTLLISTRIHDERVQLRVEDSGPGVPDDVLPHIFEPFYTTRPTGSGTGLGLSMCYSIVLAHKGRLYYEARPTGGACFTVELPLAPTEPAQALAPTAPRQVVPSPPVQNTRRILVVDDEAGIAELLREMLGLLGYNAVSFNGPELALAALAEEPCDLVISDFRMPGMSGGEFYHEALRQHPYLEGRFIFVTGDIINEETKNFFHSTGLRYILKPFQLAAVESAINQALHPAPAAPDTAPTVLSA